MRRHIGHRINVQLLDGSTIAGTLDRVTRRDLELVNAVAVAGGRQAAIDGTAIIPRASLLWTQVV